jgi:hypothetical protein
VILGWVAVAAADVGFEAPPRAGAETVIAVSRDGEPGAGETVRVVVRPGLAGSREIAVGITDGRGRVKWTPDAPGLTEVRAGDESVAVLVAGDGPPATTAGLLALLAAGAAAAIGVGAGAGRRR